MREIKFRVWDGFALYYGDVIEWVDGELCFHSDLPSIREGCPVANYSDVAVEQYTGLKDKNGKEIFEGDIIQTPKKIYKECIKVEWQEDCGGFYPFICRCDADYLGEYDDVEVVGNIHENSELLEN